MPIHFYTIYVYRCFCKNNYFPRLELSLSFPVFITVSVETNKNVFGRMIRLLYCIEVYIY